MKIVTLDEFIFEMFIVLIIIVSYLIKHNKGSDYFHITQLLYSMFHQNPLKD
jgi:hypothetical protein